MWILLGYSLLFAGSCHFGWTLEISLGFNDLLCILIGRFGPFSWHDPAYKENQSWDWPLIANTLMVVFFHPLFFTVLFFINKLYVLVSSSRTIIFVIFWHSVTILFSHSFIELNMVFFHPLFFTVLFFINKLYVLVSSSRTIIFVIFWHSVTISFSHSFIELNMSRLITQPTKSLCAQRRLRSAWASAQSDQSLPCVLKGS